MAEIDQVTTEDEEPDIDLDSDQLGAYGESLFAALCEKVGLFCNKATRDRSGWDFIVEFPVDPLRDNDLDKRPNPISCVFQQKTMWDRNDRIRFRLSSLERLAKDSRPSFVFVIKVDERREPSGAFLIPLRGEVLGGVLRALRTEQAANRFAVNRAYHYMYTSKVGLPLAFDADVFRSTLQSTVGDQAVYEAAKLTEMETLGYEPSAIEMNVRFSVGDHGDLFNVWLGRTPAIADDLRMFQTRFGVKLALQEFEPGTRIHIKPVPIDTCDVIVRRDRHSEPAAVKASVYATPKMVGVEFGMLISADRLEIEMRGGKMKFQTGAITSESPVMTVGAWRNHLLLLTALGTEGAILDIRPRNPRHPRIRHKLSGAAGLDVRSLTHWLTVAGRLEGLVAKAGTTDQPTLSKGQLTSQADRIASAHAIMTGETEVAVAFTVDGELPPSTPSAMKGVYVDHLRFADGLMVWCADVEFEREADDHAAFTCTHAEFRSVEMMSESEYEPFLKDLGTLGAGLVVARELTDILEGDSEEAVAE